MCLYDAGSLFLVYKLFDISAALCLNNDRKVFFVFIVFGGIIKRRAFMRLA